MGEAREPWWRVTSVFDPDGTGSDFGYTEGLAAVGKPELHIWARPTGGEDPGLDWKFSMRDCCRILNQLAWRLLDGRLAVGDTWSERYDGGFVEARFSVGAPVDADSVDAFGARGAPVLPISWELRRPPIGEPGPMEPSAQAEAAATYERIVSRPAPALVPPGWQLPIASSWAADERFGPRTPLVLARAAQLWSATFEEWERVLDHVLVADDHSPAGHAHVVATAAAREPGRARAVDELDQAVDDLMAGFGSTWVRAVSPWLRAWFLDGLDATPEQADAGWRGATEILGAALRSHLGVEVVADVVPDWVVRLGQGPVLAALCPPGVAPEPRWLCSPTIDRAVTGLVARTAVSSLVEAAAAWSEFFFSEPGQAIVVRMWTGAGCFRQVDELMDPAACASAATALRSRGWGLGSLQVWLASLATVLAERPSLDPVIVDEFLRAGRSVAGLASLVNSPLTGDVV